MILLPHGPSRFVPPLPLQLLFSSLLSLLPCCWALRPCSSASFTLSPSSLVERCAYSHVRVRVYMHACTHTQSLTHTYVHAHTLFLSLSVSHAHTHTLQARISIWERTCSFYFLSSSPFAKWVPYKNQCWYHFIYITFLIRFIYFCYTQDSIFSKKVWLLESFQFYDQCLTLGYLKFLCWLLWWLQG